MNLLWGSRIRGLKFCLVINYCLLFSYNGFWSCCIAAGTAGFSNFIPSVGIKNSRNFRKLDLYSFSNKNLGSSAASCFPETELLGIARIVYCKANDMAKNLS